MTVFTRVREQQTGELLANAALGVHRLRHGVLVQVGGVHRLVRHDECWYVVCTVDTGIYGKVQVNDIRYWREDSIASRYFIVFKLHDYITWA